MFLLHRGLRIWQCLWVAWVRSLVQHGLRIQHCHSCGVGCSCGLDLIPGQEISICCGYSHKKKKLNTHIVNSWQPGWMEREKGGREERERNSHQWSSRHGSGETNLTSIHEDTGSSPSLTQWAKQRIWHCHELWYRSQKGLGSDVAVCGVGQWLQRQFNPQPGNLHMIWVWP